MTTKEERIAEAKKATGGIADLFDEEGNYDPFLQVLLQKLENKFKESMNLDNSIEQINKEERSPYIVTRQIEQVFSTKSEYNQFLTYVGMATASNKVVVVLSGRNSIDTYFIGTAPKLEELTAWGGKIIPNAVVADEQFVKNALVEYGVNLLPADKPVVFVDKNGTAMIRTNELKPCKVSYTRETPFAFAVCFDKNRKDK